MPLGFGALFPIGIAKVNTFMGLSMTFKNPIPNILQHSLYFSVFPCFSLKGYKKSTRTEFDSDACRRPTMFFVAYLL